MKVAYNLIRDQPVYRRQAFDAGLAACGYRVRHEVPTAFNPGDVLLIWNRYWHWHELALKAEAAGAVVLVAENGYIGPGGSSPHHSKDRQTYALARGYHNDDTAVLAGGPERWDALGVDLRPWRTAGRHVLICPNRTFGVPGRAMTAEWPYDTMRAIQKLTKREVRMRVHPGNDLPKKPLAEDLAGCHAVVIWASSAGVHALVAGIPVICCAPFWIAKDAAGTSFSADTIEVAKMDAPARLAALRRLAWGQWNVQEISSGEAFRHVLRPRIEAEVAAHA